MRASPAGGGPPRVRPGPVWGPYPLRSEPPPPWQALSTRLRLQRARPLFLRRLQALAGGTAAFEDLAAPQWRARLRGEGFEAALSKADKNKPVNMLVRRGEWAQYVLVRPAR